jgi:hypothetical protein
MLFTACACPLALLAFASVTTFGVTALLPRAAVRFGPASPLVSLMTIQPLALAISSVAAGNRIPAACLRLISRKMRDIYFLKTL